MKLALVVIAAAGAGAYALVLLGRRAVFGELAGKMGDDDAKSAADAMSVTAAMMSGLRTLAGRQATGGKTLLN